MNRWRETNGKKPNTSAEKAFVRYRCGLESKQAYPVKYQRWNWRGEDFDIIAYRVEIERQEEAA